MKTTNILAFFFLFIHMNSSLIAQNDDYILLVVDVQEFKKVDEKIPKEVYHVFLKEVNRIISVFPSEKVAYIKNMNLALSISFKGTKVDTLDLPDLHNSLLLVNDQIFIKSKGDSFTSHHLDQFLEKYPNHKVLVIGLIADGCVYSTLKSGCKNGYDMYIIPEAILAWSEKNKEKYLKKYQKLGVKDASESFKIKEHEKDLD